MKQYAKYIDKYTVIYPTELEFHGIPNWQYHDALLRSRNYYPLEGTPPVNEGYKYIPKIYEFHKSSKIVQEIRNADPVTHELFIEDTYDEDPETHEQVKSGSRYITKLIDVEYDTSYIEITDWTELHDDVQITDGVDSPQEVATNQYELEFNNACEQFRLVCNEIQSFLGVHEFKGGFDEVAIFMDSEVALQEPTIANSLANKWMALDKLCTYLGSKIGLDQPAWWYKCWELANEE